MYVCVLCGACMYGWTDGAMAAVRGGVWVRAYVCESDGWE